MKIDREIIIPKPINFVRFKSDPEKGTLDIGLLSKLQILELSDEITSALLENWKERRKQFK